MKKIKLILLLSFLIFKCFSENNENFILMTTLYEEPKEERINEFFFCLEKNNENINIDKIIILFEGHKNRHFVEDKIKNLPFFEKKCKLIPIISRPTFEDFFKIANEHFLNRKIIIANADIFFDDSLQKIKLEQLDNIFIALTRWDKAIDGNFYPKDRELIKTPSQDSWIFLSPIRPFFSNIQLGILGCDPSLTGFAKKARYKVINPALNIRSYHIHESNIRTYSTKDNYDNIYPYLFLKLNHWQKN